MGHSCLFKVALPLAAASVWASPTAAQLPQRDINGWQLTDHGESCALSRTAPDGAISYITDGVTAGDGIGFTSPKFKGIKDRVSHSIAVTYGGKMRKVTAEGMDNGGPARGFIVFDYPIADLAAQDYSGELTFKWKGRIVHRFPVQGLRPAMQALADCSAAGRMRRGLTP